ncbi:MAG: FeoA family protein [Thermodesulfobacteriota bacterium]|nr:FeoA family protein [Thermodesulfobacteriota bacterium]
MQKRLDEMAYEEEGVVAKVQERARTRVAGMGVRVGKKIKMLTKEPLKGPVVVVVDEADISLGVGIADKIIVEVDG